MKAALLTEINKPLALSTVRPCFMDKPRQSPGFGQVYVRVLASGICGAQLQEIRGEKGRHFPRLIGHEGCGIVEHVGEHVTTVRKGDKVVMHWRKGDGLEGDEPGYMLPDGGFITGGQVVTFATHSVCSENRLTKVPDDAPVELCALLGCGLSTALGTIEQEANLKMGESVLIIGCGGLGLNLIRAAKMRRASRIIAADVVGPKQSAAISAGATQFSVAMFGASDAGPYDAVIDTSGNESAIKYGLECLAPSGRFIMVGQPSGAVTIANGRAMFDGEGKTIKATQGGGFRPHLDIPRYYNLWKSGQLDLNGIITHRLTLEEINEGLDLVRNGQAGRVIIEMP